MKKSLVLTVLILLSGCKAKLTPAEKFAKELHDLSYGHYIRGETCIRWHCERRFWRRRIRAIIGLVCSKIPKCKLPRQKTLCTLHLLCKKLPPAFRPPCRLELNKLKKDHPK